MRQFEHGGNIHTYLRENGEIGSFLDFSANINPLGMPLGVESAVAQTIPWLVHYPDPDGSRLKEAIAARYGLSRETITLGNGAVELLYVLCHTMRPKTALIPAPTFSEYERAARAAGTVIRYWTQNAADGFALSAERLAKELDAVDLLFIGNPNNPTGLLLRRDALEPVVAAAREAGCFVVIDESFVDFLADDEPYTCRSLVEHYDNLMILHSLTKIYAIPGLRLGFCLTSPSLCRKLHAGKDPWNVNALAQSVGVAALRDVAYLKKGRRLIAKEKDRLFGLLQDIPGLHPFKPSVNFILFRFAHWELDIAALKRRLAEQRILIRDCANYPGLDASYGRVAVKLPAENNLLVLALKNTIGGKQ